MEVLEKAAELYRGKGDVDGERKAKELMKDVSKIMDKVKSR